MSPAARPRIRHEWKAAAVAALFVALGLYAAWLHHRARGLDRQWRDLAERISPASADRASLLSLANVPAGTLSIERDSGDAIASLIARTSGSEGPDRTDAALTGAIAASPNSAYLHLARGLLLTASKRYDAALGEFEEARRMSPRDAGIPLQIGLAYFAMGERGSAERAFQQALAIDPALSDACLGLAYVNNTLARRRLAVHWAGRYSRLRPRASEGHMMLARIYLDSGKVAAAGDEARLATRIRPGDYASWYVLGLVQVATSANVDAAESFTRAGALNPNFAPARYELGRLELQGGRTAEAAGELRRAVDLWPNNGAYHWSLAQALRRAGELQDAERETRLSEQYLSDEREQKRLARRIRDHPGDLELYEELSALHMAHGRPERAAQILRDALAISPGSERLQALLQEAERGSSTGGSGR